MPSPARGAGVLYAASLWLSNSAYLYLSVSFIQMTKSLMPGLVYACGVVLGTERYQARAAESRPHTSAACEPSRPGSADTAATAPLPAPAPACLAARRPPARPTCC